MKKLINKICEIIIGKKEVNKKPQNTKKKESNKVRRNKWGFPTI
tara:strand:+ start:420 stop:551 length:132 start_codon:yes stop_codon:yes gene_type:complete